MAPFAPTRSEEHTSELQSRGHLVCRLLLEKKRTVSGSPDLNSGNQSINGQREAANGFMINGANVNEGKNNGTAFIPNLDSIYFLSIIANNIYAPFPHHSGFQI